ncbi:hypothetical protein L21SP3_01617 [Sedimentisphaera cyanobacteriorum]|uniref:Uncharacterized protein n=1 Tax=Sedimentisphaera cyanobacteriorum TaxID=1940790 RepID=A0A1Q2HQW3_9BACT|nr:hypothetical protein [Sedimentisphaera cyanobacteriorum]AQQ09802.1 hypothetical protein L21SP3_01617 [Sedimentisphaera cyanobacteriorum]
MRIYLLMLFLIAVTAAAVPVADGLILHFDAGDISGLSDGDELSEWQDSADDDTVSGDAYSQVGTGEPAYKTNVINGLPAVRFERNQEDVLVSSQFALPNPSQGLTVFIVCTGGQSGSVERAAQIGSSAGTASHLMGIDVSSNTSGCRYNNGFSLTPADSNPVEAGQFHIGVRQMQDGGTHSDLFYSCNDLEPENIQANNPSNVITFDRYNNDITIGTGRGPDGQWYPDFYEGDLAELIIYNRQLITSELQEVGDYLSQKYSLPFTSEELLIDETGGDTTVQEGGFSDIVNVSVSTDPAGYPVQITPEDTLDPSQTIISPSSITIDSDNWQDTLSFTVTAVDDDFMERPVHDTTIIFDIQTDPSSPYYGMQPSELWVDIEDNDCGSQGFSRQDLNLDCRVNLEDFYLFADEWLACGLPDPECQPSALQ